MARMSAGQAVVESLRAEGVKYIFGVVGSAFLEIMDPMYGLSDLQFVGTRHEQGAAFMALGYAHASGQPGVCMATNGPGATNLVTGIAGAYLAPAPVIALVGGISLEQTARGAFQELDHVSIFRPITKASVLIPNAQRIPELLRQAFRVATSGRMGPVLVDIPRDIQNEQDMEVEVLPPERYRSAQRPAGDPQLVEEAVGLLKEARFPVIVVGGGVKWSKANEKVERLADCLGAPMVASYGRMDAVNNDHPLYIGGLGRAGAPEATEVVQQADIILAIGTRLGHFTTFYDHRYIPKEARIIQIEIDQDELGRSLPISVGILGDAKMVSGALLEHLERTGGPSGREERLNVAAELRARRGKRLDEERPVPGTVLKPQQVYHQLRQVYPNNAATVLDAGGVCAYGYDRLIYRQRGTLYCPLDLGCVGASYPIALGVKMACPDQPVISINGDGGMLMNIQELETAVRWKIPVVAIVMNNGSWGSEKAYQKFFYGERYIEADISNPRYDRLVELFGGRGFYAETPQDVGRALEEALKLKVPSVIEIPVDPDELPFPARAADVLRHRQPTRLP